MILFEHSHSQSGGNFDITLGRLDFTGKDLEESGFPGPVGPDDPIAISLGEGNIHFIKEDTFTKQQGNIIRADHAVKI
jgi:hypothetical protein